MEPLKRVGLWLIVLAALQAFAADQIISKPRPAGTRNAADLFSQYDAASFAKLPQARQVIDPDAVNFDLLDAAVFHETNRRRQQQRLPALKYDESARAAAQMQSRDMAKGGFVDHENPDPTKKTMNDRAKLAGLRPRALAENVASDFRPALQVRAAVLFARAEWPENLQFRTERAANSHAHLLELRGSPGR